MVTNLSKQQLEVYLLLKEHHGREISINDITESDELNIKGYTARITELRQKGYRVLNTRKNHYQLIGEPEPTMADLKLIWIEAKKRGYINLMTRCEEKAQQLKLVADIKEYLL